MSRPRILYLLAVCLLAVLPAIGIVGEAVWIDVRTADEFSESHVSQAVNIPYDQIGEEITTVTGDKEVLIYVYCRSGRRSGIAKETLEGLGYTQVINVGGLDDALSKAGQKPNP